MNYISGIDTSTKIDEMILTIKINNTCIEEMQDIWDIGDEYYFTDDQYKSLKINKKYKFIVKNIREIDNDSVFLDLSMIKDNN